MRAAIFDLTLTSLATATVARTCGTLATANFALMRPSFGVACDSWR